jgi:hypothetical protein
MLNLEAEWEVMVRMMVYFGGVGGVWFAGYNITWTGGTVFR